MKIYFGNSFSTNVQYPEYDKEGHFCSAADWMIVALRKLGHDVDVGIQFDGSKRYDVLTQILGNCSLSSKRFPIIPMLTWDWSVAESGRVKSLNKAEGMISPSKFITQAYINAGYPKTLTRTGQLGVDAEIYHPDTSPMKLKTTKRFKFFTFAHEQVYLVISAFVEEFDKNDDVVLIFKGGGPLESDITTECFQFIERLKKEKNNCPEILTIDKKMSAIQLASLYTAVDCTIAKSIRSSGWGLMLNESMACGIPVITSTYGAYGEFANEENAFIVRHKEVEANIPGSFISPPKWSEPDICHLKELMRYIILHPEERNRKSKRALEDMRNKFTWQIAAEKFVKNIEELLGQRKFRVLRKKTFLFFSKFPGI